MVAILLIVRIFAIRLTVVKPKPKPGRQARHESQHSQVLLCVSSFGLNIELMLVTNIGALLLNACRALFCYVPTRRFRLAMRFETNQ